MAKRGNRPRDPQDTMGGVRGTHGLGDAPRERPTSAVGARGGTASTTGGSRKGGTADLRRAAAPVAREAREPHEEPEHDEATGEEHGFEMASAIGELETEEERARRRERDARAAQEDLEAEERGAAGEDVVLGDARTDRDEARERGLATERTPGPGPKDRNAGRARVTHLEEHGLKR